MGKTYKTVVGELDIELNRHQQRVRVTFVKTGRKLSYQLFGGKWYVDGNLKHSIRDAKIKSILDQQIPKMLGEE